MNTGMKITTFVAALAVTFGTAYGVGNAVDPVDSEPTSHSGGHSGSKDDPPPGGPDAGQPAAADEDAGGLRVSDGGYTLSLTTPRLAADERETLRFRVLDQQGKPVTKYQREHGKDLHLILASRDLATYRHLHPELAEDGTWSAGVRLPEAGDYRVFADFTPDARNATGLTLGADLAVSGDYAPEELPAASTTATVDDYTVTLDGELTTGESTELRLRVEKDGEPVTDLEPYLEAYGHLVALRDGDLAYLHVHPNGEPGDGTTKPGPEVSFTVTAPTAAEYRLFLDFQHEGKVRTAAFTVQAEAGGDTPATAPESGGEESEGHH